MRQFNLKRRQVAILSAICVATAVGDGDRGTAFAAPRERFFPLLRMSRLRGGAPKAMDAEQSFPPGSLPAWAEDIVEHRNSTTPLLRVRQMRRILQESSSSDESDANPEERPGKWGGVENGWIDTEASSGDDPLDLSSGEFASRKDRREFTKMLKDVNPEGYHPKIHEQGGHIKMLWEPDEPAYENVTLRKAIPMVLHPDLVHPNRSDPGFFLREAAKLGEEFEIERQVKAGAPVDCTDPLFSDWTPLHYAAWNGHASSCAKLLKLGASPFPLDHAGWTPWECAILMEREEVMIALKANGAAQPYKETELPLNTTAERLDEPFLCSNEFFNPNFTQSDMYKFWSHRWINAEDDEEHPPGGGLQSTALAPSGPPVLPEWKGRYVDRVQQAELNVQKTEPGVVDEDEWEPERDEEGRILLTCSFAHKERCKALGGRWSMENKRWFVPPGTDPGPFREWWPAKPRGWKPPENKCGADGSGLMESCNLEEKEDEAILEDGESDWRKQELRCLATECVWLDSNMSANAVDFDFMGLQRKSFKDRPPHATMQGWDDDRVSKWAESDMGKRWEAQVQKNFESLNITDELEQLEFISSEEAEKMIRRAEEEPFISSEEAEKMIRRAEEEPKDTAGKERAEDVEDVRKYSGFTRQAFEEWNATLTERQREFLWDADSWLPEKDEG